VLAAVPAGKPLASELDNSRAAGETAMLIQKKVHT
jgi:hypothetical protein